MGLDMSLFVQETKDGGITDVGYWRKANAIHKWFVDKCWKDKYDTYQGEVIEVSKKEIEELKDLCLEVQNKIALVTNIEDKLEIIDTKLPMQNGFFFGYSRSEDGIEFYEYHLKETIKIIEKILKMYEKNKVYKLFYCASW